jgi:FdhE protein
MERYSALRAVAALLPMPFLHACNRRWSAAMPQGWSECYCFVCGAWPGFAEVCGVERSRYLRCVRCGSAWQALVLMCAYCRTTDHQTLGSLVPERSDAKSALEVCNACHGYLKVFTTLSGTAADHVMIDDLASVELDLAAAERGYKRPPGTGYALRVTVAPGGASV